MKGPRTFIALLALAFAPPIGPLEAPPLEAQSASAFLQAARGAYEKRMAGIEEYSITSRVSGVEHTTRYVRSEVDGSVLFLPQSATSGRSDSRMDPGSLFRPEVAERVRDEGEETVAGTGCRVLVLDDFEGLDFAESWSSGDAQLEPKRIRMCVDSHDYLLRRLVVEATGPVAGEVRDVTNTMDFSDYREIEGLEHPFRIELTVSGLPDMASLMGGTDQSAAIEQLRSQLDQVPEGQRARLEAMLTRMEAMQAASGGTSAPVMVIETTHVEVKRGS